MRKLKYLLFFVAMASVHAAEIKPKMELENNVVSRVEKVLKNVDPLGYVQARVELKSLETTLPGTGVTLRGTVPVGNSGADGGGISIDDILKIEVVAWTSLQNAPSWLARELEKSVGVERSKIRLSLQKMPPEMLETLNTKKPAATPESPATRSPASEKDKSDEQMSQLLRDTSTSWTQFFKENLILAGIVFGIAFLFHVFFSYQRQKSLMTLLKTELSRLSTSLSNANGDAPSRQASAAAQGFREDRDDSKAGPTEVNAFTHMGDATLLALFTDCYWCEEDSYAAFIWDKISGNQRQMLIKAWSESVNYAKYFSGMKNKKDLFFHSHPCYLQPVGTENLSNYDLKNYVKREPSLWHTLSPLRQAALHLSLTEQMNCLKAPVKGIVLPSAAVISENSKRKFKSSVSARAELSFADEEAILAQPDSVAPEFRSVAFSLVWLAMCPLEVRQKVLKAYSAQEIASAWFGCDAVIVALQESVAETKLKLIQSYLDKNTPSQNGEVYAELVAQGLSEYAAWVAAEINREVA